MSQKRVIWVLVKAFIRGLIIRAVYCLSFQVGFHNSGGDCSCLSVREVRKGALTISDC